MSRELRVLERHLRHWRERGLVGPEQEAALRAASRELDHAGASSVLRSALAFLGGGLVLAGLILVVAENWPALPRSAKLLGWAALQCAFLALASRTKGRLPAVSEALALVSGGWVLAGIALVSQIYHLDSRPPNGLWMWLVLVVPAAWLLRARAVPVVAFAAGLSALWTEVLADDSWIHAPAAAAPWLWLALPLLAAAATSLLPRSPGGLRDWLGAWLFTAATVFLLVFGASQELGASKLGTAWVPVAAGLAAGFGAPRRVLPGAWAPATARMVLGLSLLPWVLMGSRFDRGELPDALAIGVAWTAQLAVSILVVRAGARSGSRTWVNLGYLALCAGILTRYFDFFGDYLRGGAALALTGVLVLFVVYALERARRRTLGPETAA